MNFSRWKEELEVVEAGLLELPSGEIVATDPLVYPEAAPFERTVSAGNYPVYIYKYQERNAFAELRFSEKEVVSWELATVPGEDPSTLEEGELFGYGVDTGLGCFMDETTAMDFDKLLMDAEGMYFDDVLYDLMYTEESDFEDELVLNHRPWEGRSENVMIFESGWGDGFYASYWGLDADGEVVTLVTDFGVVDPEEE